jgi:hypothetical protein
MMGVKTVDTSHAECDTPFIRAVGSDMIGLLMLAAARL